MVENRPKIHFQVVVDVSCWSFPNCSVRGEGTGVGVNYVLYSQVLPNCRRWGYGGMWLFM